MQSQFHSPAIRRLGLAAATLLICASALAQQRIFDVPATEAVKAIPEFARQAGIQIVAPADDLRQVRTVALRGELDTRTALRQLLIGTGLEVASDDGRVITLRKIVNPVPAAKASVSEAMDHGRPDENRTHVARSDSMRRIDSGDSQALQGQSSSSQEPAGAKVGIEEVVVTATKRAERLQDIPMSIAAIGNQDIERRGLIGMEDYLRSIPGVNQIDLGAKDNAIVVRGITTSLEFQNLANGPTVGSYFDETPITGAAGIAAGGIDVRPVDIERIEVLRGPQGTAYGSASLSGTLRMIPMKPDLGGFSARVAGSFSSTSGEGGGNWMGQGIFNMPVVADKFAIRVVGYRYDESGFYRNTAGSDAALNTIFANAGIGDLVRNHFQSDVGRMVSTGGRASALWRVTDKLNVSLSFLTQKIEQDGQPVSAIGEYEQTRGPIATAARGRGENSEISDTKMDLASLVLNYDFGWATLISAVSSIDSGSLWVTDFSSSLQTPASISTPSDVNAFTAETRLASQLDGRFQFLGGFFYEDLDSDQEQTVFPGAASNPYGTNPIFKVRRDRTLDQFAAFGEVSYDLTDKLTAKVGGRYFKYHRDEHILREGGLAGVPLGTGVTQILKNSEDGSTFSADLSYKPVAGSLLYASWAEGFRLGQPAPGVPAASCDRDGDGLVDGSNVSLQSTRSIDSDFLDQYEIGGKFALFDRRVTVDAAIYRIKWDGLPVVTLASGCPLSFTANVGTATSTGAELQASLLVAEGLRLDFGAGYTKAELSKDAPALRASKGARLPGTPEVSANVALQYDFNVAGYRTFVRADSFYTGAFYGDLLETLGLKAGDYVKVDARAGVAIGSLSVELFLRNLTNEDAFTWRGASGGTSPFFGYQLRPRTFGVQLGYTFQ